MSAIVLLPLVIVALGAAAVATMVRRIHHAVDALDHVLHALGRLEGSRVHLQSEMSTATASMNGARILERRAGR